MIVTVTKIEVSLLGSNTKDKRRHLQLNACFEDVGKALELLVAI